MRIIHLGQNYQRTGPQHRVSLMIPLLSIFCTSWSPIFSSTNGSLLGCHFLVSAIITVNLLNWLLQEGIISLKSCRRDLIFRLWLSFKSYGKYMIYVFFRSDSLQLSLDLFYRKLRLSSCNGGATCKFDLIFLHINNENQLSISWIQLPLPYLPEVVTS